MNTMNFLVDLLKLFSPGQWGTILALALIIVLFIVLNIVLWYIFNKRTERKLCTRQLQSKREELLRRLEQIKSGDFSTVAEEEAEEEEDDATDDESEDDSDDEDDVPATATSEEAGGIGNAEVIAVADMSDPMRKKLGLAGREYDGNSYYVRLISSFEARLRLADDKIKARYTELMEELALYKGVKVKGSYRQQRIYKGRKTLGLIMFRGKTLCVAFALHPADYEDTKYRGIDKSDKKRFEKTPMLMKISSQRRLEYTKFLLTQLADANTIVMNETPEKVALDLAPMTRDELFEKDLLRLTLVRLARPEDVFKDEKPAEPAQPEKKSRASRRVSDASDVAAEVAAEAAAEKPAEKPAEASAEEEVATAEVAPATKPRVRKAPAKKTAKAEAPAEESDKQEE